MVFRIKRIAAQRRASLRDSSAPAGLAKKFKYRVMTKEGIWRYFSSKERAMVFARETGNRVLKR